ncbi:MAG: PHB depolymerase family esterase [Vampirovibrionales bacterium]|nr:PHB depolymerase family esterase [Vampirovibrionales bacterium]
MILNTLKLKSLKAKRCQKILIWLCLAGILVFGLLFGLSASDSQAKPSGEKGHVESVFITVNGHKRAAVVYVPSEIEKKSAEAATSDKRYPLLLAYHGYLGSARQMMRMSGFNPIAENDGFLVAYPNALHRKWLASTGSSEFPNDDVNFSQALIKKLAQTYPIDPSRIYATGFSSGGFFTERLACELSAIKLSENGDTTAIAAIAPVAATIGKPLSKNCKLKRPVSVLMLNGTDDPIVTWNGKIRKVHYAFHDAEIATVPETAVFWQRANLCSPTPRKRRFPLILTWNDQIAAHYFPACRGGVTVEQWILEGGGHTWPGALPRYKISRRIFGKTLEQPKASEVIWNFLQKRRLAPAY